MQTTFPIFVSKLYKDIWKDDRRWLSLVISTVNWDTSLLYFFAKLWHIGWYLVDHECFLSIFYGNVKKCFENAEHIRENLPGIKELFELPILKSGDLNLKACAFMFLIVLLLC